MGLLALADCRGTPGDQIPAHNSTCQCYAHRRLKLRTEGSHARVRELGSIRFFNVTSENKVRFLPKFVHIIIQVYGTTAANLVIVDYVPYWCHGLEVYPGSCSGLPPRSLLSHPGHQRSQVTPLIGIGVTFCSFCSYLHNPGPCILGGWPLCVEWVSSVANIAQDSF